MAIFQFIEDPGHWQDYVLRREHKGMTSAEIKKKFLTEQLEWTNYVSSQRAIMAQQQSHGGFMNNCITNIAFNSTPLFCTVTGVTTTINVCFCMPVAVTGTPTVSVDNDQIGGGSTGSFTYDYASGTNTEALIFNHVHPAYPCNNGGVAANCIACNIDLMACGATASGSGMTMGDYSIIAAYTSSTGGTAASDKYMCGSGMNFDITVGQDADTSCTCISAVTTTESGSGYIPGMTVCINTGQTGGSSTGAYINFPDGACLFSKDNLTIPANGSIGLGGGTITTTNPTNNTQVCQTIRRQGSVPNLDFNNRTGIIESTKCAYPA